MLVRSEPSAEEVQTLLSRTTMNFREAAQALGCGETNLRSAIKKGDINLNVIAIGTRRIIPTSGVRRLLGLEEVTASPVAMVGASETEGI